MSAINVIPRTLGLLAVFALAAASARGDDPPVRPPFDPEEVFNQADTDGDGKMSKQEFQFVVANGPRLRDDPQRADRVFGRLDADKDGSLSPAEFRRLAAMRGGPPGRPPAPARAPEKAPEKVADRQPTAEQVAFFEKKIRPVLVEQCYECHSAEAKKVKGGLLLDTRDGIRQRRRAGAGRRPRRSRGEPADQGAPARRTSNRQMPPKQQLPDEVIADFETWVDDGRARPARRRRPPSRSTTIDIEKGRQFWAFQPPQAADAARGEGRRLAATRHRPLRPGRRWKRRG